MVHVSHRYLNGEVHFDGYPQKVQLKGDLHALASFTEAEVHPLTSWLMSPG